MRITEFTVERSQDVLTVRRTVAWKLLGLIGAAFLLAILACFWHGIFLEHPRDWVSILFLLAMSVYMAFIFYRILVWGSLLIFDKGTNQFLIDGRRVCTLSDLAWVRLDVTYRSPVLTRRAFITLHLKTVRGRDIVIKSSLERSREHDDWKCLGLTIADFTGIRSNIHDP